MNPTDRPIANPVVVLREEFDDWAVLFNPDTAAAAGINPVGVAIWKQLDGRRSITEIAVEIQNAFKDTPAAVSSEIEGFINQLDKNGFAGLELGSA